MEVHAGYTVVMPSNNQTKYPPNASQNIIMKSNNKIKLISNDIKKRLVNPVSKSFTSLIAPPISKMMFPKSSDRGFEVDDCNSCGLCTKVCPNNNIILSEGRPKWQHDCSRCTACLQLCPKSAIQYGSSRNWGGRYRHPQVTIKDLIIE